MNKWEYCRIVWRLEAATEDQKGELIRSKLREGLSEVDGATFIGWGYLKICGSQQEPRQIFHLSDTIAELGLEGWEMVNVSETSLPTTNEVIYFKRPIPE